MNLKFLIIHCTATPEGVEVSSGKIKQWHLGPRNNANGTVTYMGHVYKSRKDLPEHQIDGVDISKLLGRGWRQVGYTDMFHLNGGIERLVQNNEDGNVDPWEITNGATGINSVSRHIVYVGGMTANNKMPKDTRTKEQKAALIKYVREFIAKNPDILIAGHKQFAPKACPSFDVPIWLKINNIPAKNIYKP